jgi:hypothetical protein
MAQRRMKTGGADPLVCGRRPRRPFVDRRKPPHHERRPSRIFLGISKATAQEERFRRGRTMSVDNIAGMPLFELGTRQVRDTGLGRSQ